MTRLNPSVEFEYQARTPIACNHLAHFRLLRRADAVLEGWDMFDLIVKNATLPDGRTGIDIACSNGKISAVDAGISAEARDVVDAEGHLVSAPFVDPHFHMDATLSLGTPRINASGTLLEGIALWGELKQIQTVDDIVDRALKYCRRAAAMGIGAIRSHVDICCLLYTSPSPRDLSTSRMPSSA